MRVKLAVDTMIEFLDVQESNLKDDSFTSRIGMSWQTGWSAGVLRSVPGSSGSLQEQCRPENMEKYMRFTSSQSGTLCCRKKGRGTGQLVHLPYPVGEPWEAEPFGLVDCKPHDAGKLGETRHIFYKVADCITMTWWVVGFRILQPGIDNAGMQLHGRWHSENKMGNRVQCELTK
jgi:hypothetical protein